ncbi:sugar transferase [Pricia sp. S334]|uniref:Sugar transferase n=1 Tax=Pricia mediterranea TaxID=3076079 RepID=A0ABU3L6N1_9FLAO|nr:sugar transferase [Pricia sp. S334]MDT7829342.1 sugar transferase [Pricia sp. S334]
MYGTFVKPLFDFVFALLFTILLFPIYTVIYLLLLTGRTDDPLFFQSRPGKDNKIFNIVKFKTMTDGKNAQGELLPDDDRVTPLGAFLRRTSLDELPQLLSVLNGDMSIVGPRPLRVRYLPYYSSREALRHTVKPGITGLAQVSGRNSLSWDKRLEMDASYVEKMGFVLDCKIILKTFIKVFDSSGIEFSDEPDSLDEYRCGKQWKVSGKKDGGNPEDTGLS